MNFFKIADNRFRFKFVDKSLPVYQEFTKGSIIHLRLLMMDYE